MGIVSLESETSSLESRRTENQMASRAEAVRESAQISRGPALAEPTSRP